MQLELRVRNTDLADALQRYIEQRLSFELGRYGDRVGRVVVKVSGLNGSRGGTKKSCRISAELRPFGRVAVQETDLDLYTAVDRAAGRIGRLFGQRLNRAQELRFETQTAPAV
jgi:putative sigma-54 modulation protein